MPEAVPVMQGRSSVLPVVADIAGRGKENGLVRIAGNRAGECHSAILAGHETPVLVVRVVQQRLPLLFQGRTPGVS